MAQKSIPKRYETFIPILEAIQDGEALSVNEISERVIKKHYPNLPPEILGARFKSGQLKIVNEIGWAVSALNMAKLLTIPERGRRRITNKGLAILATGKFTTEDLHSDKDFITYRRSLELSKKSKMPAPKDNSTMLDDSLPSETIERGISHTERIVKDSLLNNLKQIHWYGFEEVILILLERMGYGSFKTTPKSNDGGIDGIINQDELGFEKIYIQAKQYKDNMVRAAEMKNFIGSLSGYDTRKGVFATTSGFDKKSQEIAEKAKDCQIILINGSKLVDLMYEHDCGVRLNHSYEVKELDPGFFDEQLA